MALMVHRAAQAAELAEGLAALLASPLVDPFATDVVVVHSRGVERWLSQRLSHRLGAVNDDGVCAGVDFMSLSSFGRLVGEPEGGPWSVAELTWTVLAVIDASLDEPWCRTVAVHLGHLGYFGEGDDTESQRGRRFATAQRLAQLFVSYAAQRPEMLLAWEAGQNIDGLGAPLPEDLSWQPSLWRRVCASVDQPSPVHRHLSLCEEVASGQRDLELSSRVSLFGHLRISEAHLQLLRAVAAQRDVHLWLPHPSPSLWRDVAALGEPTSRRRRDDVSYAAAVHPLLAAWGRDVRELQLRLGSVAAEAVENAAEGSSLLAALQADITANRLPTQVAEPDTSISVHNCHGPSRQVEVLRELLVGMLQDDQTLQPRDIVVMCPDMNVYAPLIEAAFGLGDTAEVAHPGQRLRVRLADRSLVQANPLMGVLTALLTLAEGRAEASRVLDLLALPPVRRRFAFSDEDLEKMAVWVEETGVRWAFDAARRTEYGLEAYPQNTWQFGLDRLLAGVALSDDSHLWLGQTLPLDDVGSADIDLVGRFAEAVNRMASTSAALSGRHPLTHWVDTLTAAVDALALPDRGEGWQAAQVRSELGTLLDGARATGQVEAELTLSDVRALVSDRVAGRPARASFRAGSLTVCTLMPLRSVPHRVVCLLGLDDGVFPRVARTDGDDVLARTSAMGERDPRSEDRQLLLDAVLAASDRLIITYSGRDEVTGAQRPPSVVLGELLDVVRAMTTASGDDPRPGRGIEQEEPLQAFSTSLLDARAPRSFDEAMAHAAHAARGPRVAERALGDAVLEPHACDEVELDDLISFLGDPARAFARQRLEIALDSGEKEGSDALPIELDPLTEWQVGTRMMRELFDGSDTDSVLQREWRRGVLPPGRLGWALANTIVNNAAPIVTTAQAMTQGASASARDISVDLGGRLLTGTVTDLYDTRVVTMTYSKLGPKPQLEAWVSLLALAAASPGRGWTAGVLGRGRRTPVERVAFSAPEDPAAILRALVDLYEAGLNAPLPLPLRTAHAWAEGYRRGGVSRANAWARSRWTSAQGPVPGEDARPAHVAIWGSGMRWEDLVAIPPLPGEDPEGVGTRLGALALTLWDPLSRHAHARAEL